MMHNKIFKAHWKWDRRREMSSFSADAVLFNTAGHTRDRKPINLVDETQSEQQCLAVETQSEETEIKIHT